MNKLTSCILLLLVTGCAYSQGTLLGGPCEGCEAVFEYEDRVLTPVDTLADFWDEGPKLKFTGVIYQHDGKTPAENVILYIYHTNQEGIYPKRGGETGWARRHGYIRGWIKTDEDGRYTFYTLKPGSYPSRSSPAHTHAIILEPDGGYYYIDDWNFADDPLLPEEERSEPGPKGGSGLVELQRQGDMLVAERDIILGKNVPGYE